MKRANQLHADRQPSATKPIGNNCSLIRQHLPTAKFDSEDRTGMLRGVSYPQRKQSTHFSYFSIAGREQTMPINTKETKMSLDTIYGGKSPRSHRSRQSTACQSSSQHRLFINVVLLSFLSMGDVDAFQNPMMGKAIDTKLWSSPATEQPRTWNVQQRRSRKILTDNRSGSRRKTKPMPITGYDAKSIEEYYDRRPLQVGWRLNSLGFPLLGMLL